MRGQDSSDGKAESEELDLAKHFGQMRRPAPELRSPESPTALAHRNDPVHLKNVLRQVQSDRSNLAHGWLPFAADSIKQQFGTQMCGRILQFVARNVARAGFCGFCKHFCAKCCKSCR
jgi:hypothetical protein